MSIISAVVDKRFVDKIGDKTAILRKYDMSTKILFCLHNNVLLLKRKDTFKKQNIDKISLQKVWLFAESALSSECSACLMLSPPLFIRPVPMFHCVLNLKLDFGRNITAFISWPLFCQKLSPSAWTLTRHVDKEICPRRQHYHYCTSILNSQEESLMLDPGFSPLRLLIFFLYCLKWSQRCCS